MELHDWARAGLLVRAHDVFTIVSTITQALKGAVIRGRTARRTTFVLAEEGLLVVTPSRGAFIRE